MSVCALGLRMALGATKGSVLWLVLRASAATVIVSAAAGIALTVAAAVLLAAACFATLAPARRAVRVDPGIALRAE